MNRERETQSERERERVGVLRPVNQCCGYIRAMRERERETERETERA